MSSIWPAVQTVPIKAATVINCKTDAEPVWKHNGEDVGVKAISGHLYVYRNSLVMLSIAKEDEGIYSCHVKINGSEIVFYSQIIVNRK